MDICLGTVQLGLQYGIAGNTKPSYSAGMEILNHAKNHGINAFDTAVGYGNAQELLAEFVKQTSSNDTIKIITKAAGRTEHEIISDLDIILQLFGTSSIFGYMLHRPEDMYNSCLVNSLIECKNSRKATKIGVSVYTPEDAVYAANQGWVDVIQVPYNILDQRLHKTTFFESTRSKSILVYARSVLLQGLLTMSLGDCQRKLPQAAIYLGKFIDISRQFGYSQLEAAIQFVKANSDIASLVFGVDSLDQLKQFIDIFSHSTVNHIMIQQLKAVFQDIEDERIVMPNLWYDLLTGVDGCL